MNYNTQNARIGAITEKTLVLVLCQDLVQVKMRNFSQIQPASSSVLMCALLYTRSNSSGDIKSQ